MDDIYAQLARRLRAERERSELSLDELAGAAEIDKTFVVHLEANRKKPSLETVAKLARALGIAPADLLRDVKMPDPDEDHKFVRQFAALIRGKSPQQKATIINTVKALASSLTPKPKK